MPPLSNLAVRDIETVLHPYTNLDTHRTIGPIVFERGEGVFLYDSNGKEYIEGLAGLWCTSLGYGNEELVEAAAEQMRRLPFSHMFAGKSHDPGIALAEKLKEIAPCEISKVFFVSSGSEANDTQVKLAWYFNNALGRPNKKKIISRLRGYHGVTVASASLTGLPYNHIDFDLPISNILHTDCPHPYRGMEAGETEEDFATRMADSLDALIQKEGPDTVAAFIAEPVMGAGGVIIPPKTYYEKVKAVLDKYDVLFIDDEVICGFGRLGTMFGAQTMGMQPDTVSVAKALSSAYQPIGAVMVPERMYQAMIDESKKLGTFGHGYTYSGHPVAAAVAVKTLEIYEREDIVGKVNAISPTFQSRLKALGEHPLVGEARGLGMIGALELVADKDTRRAFDPKAGVGAKVTAFAEAEGLIVRALGGDIIALCPPLVISEDEIGELFDRLGRALDKAEAFVSAQNLRAA
ncbi:aspartate aminotransferase family protein [Microbaculum marinisediminis]|uniref:Aspartate aminotransferase family protein n=1 Tax=Microbaculum marinisediminis TaxID=2931392 RepID=A0AAW5R4D8_9HYPH|nr:aspartate aminotransferase family protein [Microbaculum sp. A6E488]MCT8974007.1 aspartate aminotransferase family protein [Microbaculum sp. A6E488]